jgi:putative MATE family efflux protein
MTSSKFTSKPLFSRQALTALLLPLIAEQALSVTIGLADTLMVSSVGEAAVSGVSLVDSFNTLMIQIMSALATGGAVVTSQYIGHREPKNAKAAAAQILFVLSSFSLVVAAVVVVGRHAILRGIFGSIDADVMRYAETYFLLSALSYPFIGLYNAGAALFRAQGNSKISMLSSLVMNVVNIGGNAVLIFGFGMGVMGAALASLISRAVACFAVLSLLQKPACPLRVEGLQALKPDGGLIRRILRVGIPAGIENGMFQIGKLSVSSLTSTLGTAAIAANAVANTTTTFLNIPANAVGMAALTVVGQCLGAGEKEQAVYYSRRLLLTAYCGAWIMNISAFLFANKFAISLFHLSPEAQAMALEVMVWFNIVSLFFWPSSFTLPNILRAAGDARFTMSVSIFSMWAFRVGFCYLMVLAFHGGLLSIWTGMFLDWVFRSLCFFVRFVRGRWMEQNVI